MPTRSSPIRMPRVRRLVAPLLAATLVAVAVATVAVAQTVPTRSEPTTRVLAYGDSNTWGWIPLSEGFPTRRLPDGERWAGVVQGSFGGRVSVVVDGLVGRTTDIDRSDAIGAIPGTAFNGRRGLLPAIAAEGPVDLVVIMLGTNDLQAGSVRTPEQVAEAAMKLARDVRGASDLLFGRNTAPRVLVVAPPAFTDTARTGLGGLFASGEPASRELAAAFVAAGRAAGVPVLDASRVVDTADSPDGLHLTRDGHAKLGRAIAARVSELLDLPLGSPATAR